MCVFFFFLVFFFGGFPVFVFCFFFMFFLLDCLGCFPFPVFLLFLFVFAKEVGDCCFVIFYSGFMVHLFGAVGFCVTKNTKGRKD